ncbi:MAG TPA: cyclodeaminase/cyclohydrolase family protein [Anaerolineales bacterium]|nr:cyclodeaminase/cyclohydrolase family protein [Anaerolineales bacterium]
MEFDLASVKGVLDPEDNITGGGAASAIAAAMAAGLVGLVARVSIGKRNMVEPDAVYREIDARAQELAAGLVAGSNADSAAFGKVMDAYRMPRDTDGEKAARSRAIQDTTAGATDVPLANAALGLQVLEQAARLEGRSNTNTASDLECAIFLAVAGVRGVLSNAAINIEGMTDPAQVGNFKARYAALEEKLAAYTGRW